MSSQKFQPPTDSLSDEVRACWRHLPDKGLFFGLLAIWLLLFHFLGNSSFGYIPTKSLFLWMSSAYQETEISDDGHGNLIPFLVLGIIWWKREELLSQSFRTWWPGLLIVGLGLMAHITGYVVQQQRLSIVGLFTGLYGLTGLIWGPRWLLATFFPFFLFAFMVPLGSLTGVVTFPLQLTVTWIVEHLFNDVLGISVVRAGTQLFDAMGSYKYDVAPACGGMRSLISIFLISISYAFLVFRSPWKRVVMIAASLPLAVIGNTVRLSTIVAAGAWQGQSAGEWVHDNSLINMLPYIPAIMGVMWLGRFLEKTETPPPALAATPKNL